jgi:alanyl-tRNA synthetase
VDTARRRAIERHHSVTHLLHWALHEVVSAEATQKGSSVAPEKLTFDFNSAPLTPDQVRDIEALVNSRIVENAPVSGTPVAYADVRGRPDIMQFFGDKYGETVRVVQIGGQAGNLDGYSMELCAGTHVRATGEIGLFRILSESAIAAGVRRIEAVAGQEAAALAAADAQRLNALAAHLNAPLAEIEKKLDALLASQKDLEKQLKTARAREASARVGALLADARQINGTPWITARIDHLDAEALLAVAEALRARFDGAFLIAGDCAGQVILLAGVSQQHTARVQAGKLIQAAAAAVDGRGGGRPDFARGGGKSPDKIPAALQAAEALL